MKEFLNIMSLVNQIIKIKKLRKKTHLILKKRAKYNKKWCKTDLEFVV